MAVLDLDQCKALAKAIKVAGIKVPDTEMVWLFSTNGRDWIPNRHTNCLWDDEIPRSIPNPDLNWLLDLAMEIFDNAVLSDLTWYERILKSRSLCISEKGPREERLCEAIIAVLLERKP